MNSEDQTNHKKSYEKKFIVRNSLLTDLFENNQHLQTVYHFLVTIFIGFFVNKAVQDYVKTGELTFGLDVIKLGFRNLHVVAVMWPCYFLMQCIVYFIFKLWLNIRQFHSSEYVALTKLVFFSKTSHLKSLWDWFGMTMLVVYYISSFTLTYYVASAFKVSLASGAILATEQPRFLMKTHSFVRNTASKVLSQKSNSEKDLQFPQFSSFVYFLFVPTLLYRESYPRKDKIDWSFVFFRFLECTTIIIFFSFIFSEYLLLPVQDFGIRKFTISELVLVIFKNFAIALLLLLLNFFLIFHSVQNLFAEVTRFGDRRFYSDWWTATDSSAFLRKWNSLVQDWIYVYIYKDFMDHVYHSTVGATFMVFAISALVHEWSMLCVFHFYLPLFSIKMLSLGFFSAMFKCPKTRIFNILFIYLTGVLLSCMFTLYTVEFLARAHSPVLDSKKGLMPIFLTSDYIKFD